MYSISQFSALYSHFQVTSGQMTHFRVTCNYLRSRDVNSCHVTAFSFEYSLVGIAMYNMPVFGPLHPLPGDFR